MFHVKHSKEKSMYGIKDYVNAVSSNLSNILDVLGSLSSAETDESKKAEIDTLIGLVKDTGAKHVLAVNEYTHQILELLHNLANVVLSEPEDDQVLVDSTTSLDNESQELQSVDIEIAGLQSRLS